MPSKKPAQPDTPFEVRDMRHKEKFFLDDEFLNGYAKLLGVYCVGVYVSLCRHANKNQKCWPSVQKIQEELGIGRDSVISSVKRLEFWKIIKKTRTGKQLVNRYHLLDRKQWVDIKKNSLKEYCEVCHIDFTSLSGRLH